MVEVRRTAGADYQAQVRVRGSGMDRLDGLRDLYPRMVDAKVLDIGMNRGAVSLAAAYHGARLVHGCDIYEDGVKAAREIFADFRYVESCFAVCDLTEGPKALKVFEGMKYDITLMLATYHKLKRIMKPADLSSLMEHLGRITVGFFAWRGTSDKHDENDAEMTALDRDLGKAGMVRVQTSYISAELGAAAIWQRGS